MNLRREFYINFDGVYMYLRTIVIVILTCSLFTVFPQNQANIWHFTQYVGLDFNLGEPEVISGPVIGAGSSVMSDTAGNLLFSAHAQAIYNRNFSVMQNGEEIAGSSAAQSCLIIQKPWNDHLYYVFTAGSSNESDPPALGLYYSVVNMNLDNGLGAVTDEKNIPLYSAWDATDKILGVRHINETDIWIITYKHKEGKYASYLLTENGIEDNPVISNTLYRPKGYIWRGMAISLNKKYLISTFAYQGSPTEPLKSCDVCKFDAYTGELEFLFELEKPAIESNNGPVSVAFSPDSKLVYITYRHYLSLGMYFYLYQYDVSQIESKEDFEASALLLSDKGRGTLRLARDGKIYCRFGIVASGHLDKYLTIIHEPSRRGMNCNYEDDAIEIEQGMSHGWGSLPNMLLDYYYRFEWEGLCQNETFVFQPNFIPDPVYIIWNFGDPASGSDNHSYELHPSHLFSGPGEFEVSVYLEYPGGRVEQTSRVVTVSEAPQADLGGGIHSPVN